jgi:outer membrane protein TolC
VRLAAASKFLKWVSAGQKRNLAAHLLELAEDRAQAVMLQIESGKLASIEQIDNDRLIYSRQERLIAAQQDLDTAAVELSLYWRDEDGHPRIPPPEALPEWPPPTLEDPAMTEAEERAAQSRPDLQALAWAIEQAENELRLARNDLAPKLDLKMEVAKHMGTRRPYAPFAETVNETQVAAKLAFQLPLQMRKARGAIREKEAAAELLRTERGFLVDQIRTDIQAAEIAVRATHRRAEASQRAAAVAHQMEAAERVRFDEGQSNLLTVNLRELAAADAESKFITAWVEHELARVMYLATLGQL